MADEQPALVLLLSNEAPLYASDLGELFASLAHDYERLTAGRQLVLASVRQGSLWAIFHDVAGVFGDANALIGFGKSISAVWQIAREGGPKARSQSPEKAWCSGRREVDQDCGQFALQR